MKTPSSLTPNFQRSSSLVLTIFGLSSSRLFFEEFLRNESSSFLERFFDFSFFSLDSDFLTSSKFLKISSVKILEIRICSTLHMAVFFVQALCLVLFEFSYVNFHQNF